MWEYEIKVYGVRICSDLVKELNIRGKEGWEVMYYNEDRPNKYDVVTHTKILFKRQIKNPICQDQPQQNDIHNKLE